MTTTVSFSFSDIHPETGFPYRLSLWRELPGVLCDALWDVEGWTEPAWDQDVQARRARAQVAPESPVPPIPTQRRRRVLAPRWNADEPGTLVPPPVDLDALLDADQARTVNPVYRPAPVVLDAVDFGNEVWS